MLIYRVFYVNTTLRLNVKFLTSLLMLFLLITFKLIKLR